MAEDTQLPYVEWQECQAYCIAVTICVFCDILGYVFLLRFCLHPWCIDMHLALLIFRLHLQKYYFLYQGARDGWLIIDGFHVSALLRGLSNKTSCLCQIFFDKYYEVITMLHCKNKNSIKIRNKGTFMSYNNIIITCIT